MRNKAPPPPRKIPLGDDGPPLVLELYVPQPISCAPSVCRRAAGSLLTITGTFPGGFRFRPTEARVILLAQGGQWSETRAEVPLSPQQLTILPPLPPSMRGQAQELGGLGLDHASDMSASLVSEEGKGGEGGEGGNASAAAGGNRSNSAHLLDTIFCLYISPCTFRRLMCYHRAFSILLTSSHRTLPRPRCRRRGPRATSRTRTRAGGRYSGTIRR